MQQPFVARSTPRLLIVEDDPEDQARIARELGAHYDCRFVREAAGVLDLLAQEAFDGVILDFALPGDVQAPGVIRSLRDAGVDLPIVILTAHAILPNAVEVMKAGWRTRDFISKAEDPEVWRKSVARVLEEDRRDRALSATKWSREGTAEEPSRRFVGDSPAVVAMWRDVERVLAAGHPITLVGESGTGKTAVAHEIARRRDVRGELHRVDLHRLGAVRGERWLFGVAGDPSGGEGSVSGYFESPESDSVLLKGLDDASPALQGRLLRVLEPRREYQRPGERLVRVARCGIILTMWEPLEDSVRDGHVIPAVADRLRHGIIRVPPLRERMEDVPALAKHFVSLAWADREGPPPELAEESLQYLMARDWPGNLRALGSAVRLGVGTGARVLAPEVFRRVLRPSTGSEPDPPTLRLEEALYRCRDRVLRSALEQAGDVGPAAKLMGIPQSSAYRHMRDHNIPTPTRRRRAR